MLLRHVAVPLARLERQQQPEAPLPRRLLRVPHHPSRLQRRHPRLRQRLRLRPRPRLRLRLRLRLGLGLGLGLRLGLRLDLLPLLLPLPNGVRP